MKEGKIWQKEVKYELRQEDQLLKQLVNANTQLQLYLKPKWSLISKQFNQRIKKSSKTSKQCRQRWYHRLCPGIKYDLDWTKQQQQVLFNLHDQQGNKWAEFSKKLPGRTDNSIKNHFYSTIRRGLRRVNQYIVEYKRKLGSFKEFKQEILNKILAVVDGNSQFKLDIKNQTAASELSRIIKKQLIEIAKYTQFQLYQQTQTLIGNLQEFSRICKKKKGTKNFQNSQQVSKKQQKQIVKQLPSFHQNFHQNMFKLPSLHIPYKQSTDQTQKKLSEHKIFSKISAPDKSHEAPTSFSFKQQHHPTNQAINSSFLNSIQQITVDKKTVEKQQRKEEELQIPPLLIQMPYQDIFQSRLFQHLIQSGDLMKFSGGESFRFGLLSESLNFGAQKSHPDLTIQLKQLHKNN